MNELFDKINGIAELIRVDNLTVSGVIIPNLVDPCYPVVVSVENFRFDSGMHNVPINFSVVVRIDGKVASNWDVCFDEDQKVFHKSWVELMNRLQRDEFKREDDARDTARAIWNSIEM